LSTLGVGRVELHTGDYCVVRADRQEGRREQLTHAAEAEEAIALGLVVAGSHGLGPRQRRGGGAVLRIEELNIHHVIFVRSSSGSTAPCANVLALPQPS
jgi:pyridoxine 5'-phosphate synthase PdxJ